MIARRRRRCRPIAPFVHELVELGLVLGVTQAIQEALELGLLFLEPLQRLLAVFVKGAIAARWAVGATAFHAGAKALHLVLHPLHLLLPARSVAAVISCH